MGDDPRRLPLTGQPVAGLPRHVAEQDVDLEVLLERLALEEGGLEGVAEGADGVGEDVVEHGNPNLPAPLNRAACAPCSELGGPQRGL